MKDRYLWIGLFIVVCSILGNSLYFQSKQLEQPIFLNHYYETYAQHESPLTFYYLSNISEPVEVSYVTIDGVTFQPSIHNVFTMWTNDPYIPNYEQKFTHHYLQSVTLQFPVQDIPYAGKDGIWTFNEMRVTFTNGQTIDATIGEVKVINTLNDTDALVERRASTDNYNKSNYLSVLKPITINSITIPFSEEVSKNVLTRIMLDPKVINNPPTSQDFPFWYKDKFDIEPNENNVYVSNANLYPIHLERDDWIKLYTTFNPNHKSYFEFYIKLHGTTNDGETFEYNVLIGERVYLTQQDVNEIIAEKQGGHKK
ncbi:MAG TPA: hypothetical protein VNR38_10260 [Ureibacillus sp.]|nr:hypothetical protein [Ureibacillus sp.]